jgi:hypothetical protein
MTGDGGVTGQGGSTSDGGSAGHGGITGSGGVTGNGGAAGSGGSTAIPTTCATNRDCAGGFCEPARKQCVACVTTADCPSGEHCLGNQCVRFLACGESRDCEAERVCDPGRGICVDCATATDCTGGEICILNQCVLVVTCQSSSECGGRLCDTSTHGCVDCLSDADCGASTEHCVSGSCRPACTQDAECPAEARFCDSATSTCLQCKGTSDCPASSNCGGGVCQADLCDSTQSTCSGNGVSWCNEAGNGWAAPSACAAGKSCTAWGGVATCDGPVSDGGPPPDDGGPVPGDGPAGCSTATASPCTAIPKFNGTQTLDGKGEDLCELPSFPFGVANAAVKINNNNIPDTQFEVVTARVGWTQTDLVAFFDVKDASVQTVSMKDPGEVFIASTDSLTGPTATDNKALHVTIPASGSGVLVKTASGGSVTHTALPAAQYAQATTSSGYAIELKLPWPGGGSPGAGGKVRFDLALNSADTNCSGVDDMRDAQLLLYRGNVSSTTCPNNSPDAWCDDRTWCSTTLQ